MSSTSPFDCILCRLVHDTGHVSPTLLYGPGKYCVDDMLVAHNKSHGGREDNDQGAILQYAYICVDQSVRMLS